MAEVEVFEGIILFYKRYNLRVDTLQCVYIFDIVYSNINPGLDCDVSGNFGGLYLITQRAWINGEAKRYFTQKMLFCDVINCVHGLISYVSIVFLSS